MRKFSKRLETAGLEKLSGKEQDFSVISRKMELFEGFVVNNKNYCFSSSFFLLYFAENSKEFTDVISRHHGLVLSQ